MTLGFSVPRWFPGRYLRGVVRGPVLRYDNEFKLSPSADEDEFDTDAAAGPGRIPGAAASAAGRRQVPAGAGEASWRGARRKRLSLPSIRLYSSLQPRARAM